mmetsp:Transcript_20999/g.27227  ORF Transcript_20999/g.27227 Transcript_20999/m.27227 type:complete len:486 (+) Transcript_20999:107-1564(+)
MGRNFRGSEYLKTTWISKRTVKDGEALIKWNYKGKATEIVGPARVRCRFATIQFLDRIKASPFEYLRVEYRDGRIEHLPGPRAIWKNPVFYEKITVEPAIHLATKSEAIVIYQTAKEKLARLVVSGPATVCPQFGERIHQFTWTQFENNEERVLGRINNGIKKCTFQTLKIGSLLPQEVRAKLTTNDGPSAILRVSLNLVIHNVEKLIDNTDDLTADLANSLESDLIVLGRRLDASSLRNLRGVAALVEGTTEEDDAAAASHMMDNTISEKTEIPVVIASQEPPFRRAFIRLVRRCEELGIELRSVELRGLDASPELIERWSAEDNRVKAQSAAAEAKLKHQANLAAATRHAEMESMEAERKGKALARQHSIDVEAARRTLELDEHKAAVLERQRVRDSKNLDQDLQNLSKRNDETIRFLSKLSKEAGVDTTKLLTAQLSSSTFSNPSTSKSAPPFDLANLMKAILAITENGVALSNNNTQDNPH